MWEKARVVGVFAWCMWVRCDGCLGIEPGWSPVGHRWVRRFSQQSERSLRNCSKFIKARDELDAKEKQN